jgi:hypothetical protein
MVVEMSPWSSSLGLKKFVVEPFFWFVVTARCANKLEAESQQNPPDLETVAL